MQPVKVPRTLPVVLSREEVSRLIAAAWNLKHQTALSVAYGAGLRATEVISLKVGDVDSQRMTLRVEQGKGRKEVFVEPAMTLAAVDRLVHHSTILEMNVESYRRRAAQQGLAPAARKTR